MLAQSEILAQNEAQYLKQENKRRRPGTVMMGAQGGGCPAGEGRCEGGVLRAQPCWAAELKRALLSSVPQALPMTMIALHRKIQVYIKEKFKSSYTLQKLSSQGYF